MTPNSSENLHPGMMGDGTEEQNLGQRGNPKARITQEEVEDAFSGELDKVEELEDEVRSFMDERWEALKDRAAEVRDQVATSAEAMRDWAADQAAAARQTAADKPVLVVSLSAATALTIGLAIGFLLGRATDD